MHSIKCMMGAHANAGVCVCLCEREGMRVVDRMMQQKYKKVIHKRMAIRETKSALASSTIT